MVTKTDVELANKRGTARLAASPIVKGAHYDRRNDYVVIDLNTGLSIIFRPRSAQGFEQATPRQLSQIEISPSGLGLHFPAIDADLYLPGLLKGLLGSRRWMAAELGKAGGKSVSDVKANAVRENGKLGGRPRKEVVSR